MTVTIVVMSGVNLIVSNAFQHPPQEYLSWIDTACSPILSNVLRIGIIDTVQSSGVGVIEVYINLMTIDILRRKDVFDQ